VALEARPEEIEDLTRTAESMENRPVVEVFDSVIRSVVSAPAGNALQVSSGVEVFVIELDTCFGLGVDEPALEEGPIGRGSCSVDGEQGTMSARHGSS
jgi:hypothetical protein